MSQRKRVRVSAARTIDINGRVYEPGEEIGSGGGGSVYRAKSGENLFAIKKIELHNEESGSGRIKNKRFINEVEFCSQYHSDHIIQIQEWSIQTLEKSDGSSRRLLYYVMPFYESTLRDFIKRDTSLEKAFELLLQLYSAVLQIHKEGVIHRDIKPENILINNNALVLADFGISHFKEENITVKQDLLANRGYFAPEQGKGYDARYVGAAADVFAVGLITNELFTKIKPSGSRFRTVADLYPHLSDLDALIANMIGQDPRDRVSIESAKSELQRIFFSFKESLARIKRSLSERIAIPISQKLIDQAAIDVLTADSLMRNLRQEDWSKYNPNYHNNIHFRTTAELQNALVCGLFLEKCKKKLDYESNVYFSLIPSQRPEEYEIRPTEEQCGHLEKELMKYKFELPNNCMDKVPNRIRKYFLSCCDYHCDELLRNIEQIGRDAKRNLDDAPILWIAQYISTQFPTIIESMESFSLCSFVEIIPEESIPLLDSSEPGLIDTELYESNSSSDVNTSLELLTKSWPGTTYYVAGDQALLFFDSLDRYQSFSNFALARARGDFVFEGDVIEILKPTYWNNDLIQLTLSMCFDVAYTLTRLLNPREPGHCATKGAHLMA